MLKGISGLLNAQKRTGRSGWEDAVNANVLMRVPAPELRPFVNRFVIVEFPSDRKLKLLPATNFVAEFRFRGENAVDGCDRLPSASICGLRDTARSRSYSGGSAILLALFTEAGAIAIFRKSLDAFFNAIAPMEEAVGRAFELRLLDEQLAASDNHAQRFNIVESFLLSRLQNSSPDPAVSTALASLGKSDAAIRIENLARQTGLSQSALERRFRQKVGTSPKRFASILRLKSAFHLRARGLDFTSIAHLAGYSDQSHFINDFKRVTGSAPSDFFRQSAICRNAEFLQVAFAASS